MYMCRATGEKPAESLQTIDRWDAEKAYGNIDNAFGKSPLANEDE